MMRRLTPLCLIAVTLVACAAPSAVGSPSPSAGATTQAPAVSPTPAGAPARVAVRSIQPAHRWLTVPDALYADPAIVQVQFEADPSAARPLARLVPGGREAPLTPAGAANAFAASIDLRGLQAGTYRIDVVEHLASGAEDVAAATSVVLSQPEYVVWTLDFEGDAASDTALANTAALLDGQAVHASILWNARVWTTTQVTPTEAGAMVGWANGRATKGDEIGLHVHAWADFVRDSGVTPRTAPNWSGRSDGYDVPLTAFDEAETRKLIDHAVELMTQHGFAKPTAFRAGGLFANAANLRAIAAAGFTVDSSATAAGGFGRLPLPWTLPKDAQPYRPSRDDANVPGDLPLLEAPNIAGNTYALTVSTIQPTIRDDLAMLAPAGQAAMARRALTLVSHPATIDATERAAIESLFNALAPLRYDRDAGPLRFVTLSQLAKAYSN